MNLIRRVLWWLGASPTDLILRMDPCMQRVHTTRGLVFGLNYLFLLFVWMSTGYLYFGQIGILCPGLIVPSILVLGLGRLIAMRHLPPAEELSLLTSEKFPARSKFSLAPRALVALTLSTVTTLLFMMNESQDLIRRSAQAVAEHANRSLLEARIQDVNALYDQKVETLKANEADSVADRDKNEAAGSQASTEAALAAQNRDEAIRERELEKGGVGERQRGSGPKHDAWAALAATSSNEYAAADSRAKVAADRVRQLNADIQRIRTELQSAEADRASALETAAVYIRQDPRYVTETKGLFSDATLFLALFSNPDEGPGLMLITALCVAFLFTMELSDLIAVLLSPCVASAAGFLSKVRLAISKLSADTEIENARRNSQTSSRETRKPSTLAN